MINKILLVTAGTLTMLITSVSAVLNSDIFLSLSGALSYFVLGLIVHSFLFKEKTISFILPLIPLFVYVGIAVTVPNSFPVVVPNLFIITIGSFILGFYFPVLAMPRKTAFMILSLTCLFTYCRFYLAPKRYQQAIGVTSGRIGTVTLYDLDGAPFHLQNTKNRVVLADFWFIGCVQCMEKLPYLEELDSAYKKDSRVTFIAVALGRYNTLPQIRQFIKKHNFKIKVLYDRNNKVAESVKFTGAPLEIIINNNSIKHTMSGFSKDIGLIYNQETRKRIDSLLR